MIFRGGVWNLFGKLGEGLLLGPGRFVLQPFQLHPRLRRLHAPPKCAQAESNSSTRCPYKLYGGCGEMQLSSHLELSRARRLLQLRNLPHVTPRLSVPLNSGCGESEIAVSRDLGRPQSTSRASSGREIKLKNKKTSDPWYNLC